MVQMLLPHELGKIKLSGMWIENHFKGDEMKWLTYPPIIVVKMIDGMADYGITGKNQ